MAATCATHSKLGCNTITPSSQIHRIRTIRLGDQPFEMDAADNAAHPATRRKPHGHSRRRLPPRCASSPPTHNSLTPRRPSCKLQLRGVGATSLLRVSLAAAEQHIISHSPGRNVACSSIRRPDVDVDRPYTRGSRMRQCRDRYRFRPTDPGTISAALTCVSFLVTVLLFFYRSSSVAWTAEKACNWPFRSSLGQSRPPVAR